MTKAELVNKMAAASGVTKVAAEKALQSCLAGIRGSLRKGEAVTLVGFGTFIVGRRKPRKGRNPAPASSSPSPPPRSRAFVPRGHSRTLSADAA